MEATLPAETQLDKPPNPNFENLSSLQAPGPSSLQFTLGEFNLVLVFEDQDHSYHPGAIHEVPVPGLSTWQSLI